MKRIVLLILQFVFIQSIFSQQVIINGKAPSYQGDELVFYTYTDLITRQETELGRSQVDTAGNFEFRFDIRETILAFIYLEVYKGFMFLEPGKNYTIKLPPKIPKKFEDQINPYFQESEFYIGVLNSSVNELNYLIKEFDNQYNAYVDENFNLIRQMGSKKVDTMINKLNREYEDYDNPYFKHYLFYKLAALRFLSYERNTNYVARYYFLNKPLLYHNIAYMELFNQVFNSFFYEYSKSRIGERIYSDVAYEKSIYKIKETLDKNMALTNDTLQELIILKACYDEAYANNYPFSSLKQTLDSLRILTTIAEHRKIAENIIRKTTHLRNGYPAPDIEIYDSTGKENTLTDYRGHYLYLNYCTDWSYKCKEEFVLLKNIYKNHADKMEIVTIVPEGDYEKLKDHFADNEYTWPLNYYINDSIIKTYKLRVYPTYYLINPKGNMTMSPAPGPNENFEWQFFTILRNQKK